MVNGEEFKMKLDMYSVWHTYLFILLLFLLFSNAFGLNRQSSGQYLQKKSFFWLLVEYYL